MKGKTKKLVMVLGAIAIIFLSIFVVTIQYQISELVKKEEESLPLFTKIFTDENSGAVPFAINFTSLVSNHEGKIEYEWDFGDGTTSNEINPSHIYEVNGSYKCSLTVTDSTRKKVTDAIMVIAKTNQGAIATIKIDPPVKSQRPYLTGLPKTTDTYDGGIIDQVINSPIPHPRLSNLDGWVTCEAQVTADPEGDKIVSYKWEIRPPSYSKRIGGTNVDPVYYFEGEKITIPGMYTYRLGDYDITLIIEDEAGGNATISTEYTIQTSGEENRIAKLEWRYNDLNTKWVTKASKQLAFAGFVINIVANGLEGNTLFPRIKIAILLVLQLQWLIEWEGSDTLPFELYGEFLEKHPLRQKAVDFLLNTILASLEKMRDKFPNQAEDIDKLIETVQQMLENLGLTNMRPKISNPFPEHKKDYMPINLPYVSIDVNDTEGDEFSIRIYGDDITEVNLTGQVSGTFTADLITSLSPLTEVKWHVEVIDHVGRIVSEDYWFKTSSI